jgi:ribosome-associated translation inhibitor RaiA
MAEISELDNRRIDNEIVRTDGLIEDVYRSIDSRLDKLENKLTNNK